MGHNTLEDHDVPVGGGGSYACQTVPVGRGVSRFMLWVNNVFVMTSPMRPSRLSLVNTGPAGTQVSFVKTDTHWVSHEAHEVQAEVGRGGREEERLSPLDIG